MPTIGGQRRTRVQVVADDIHAHLRKQVGPIARARDRIDQAALSVLGHERHGIGVRDGPGVLPDEPCRFGERAMHSSTVRSKRNSPTTGLPRKLSGSTQSLTASQKGLSTVTPGTPS